jgi:CheY-like chemotaxis protein
MPINGNAPVGDPPPAGQGSTSPVGEPGKLRALVVDDNRDAADSLVRLLASWGHEARVAYDGLAALTAAETFRPDAALVDLGLPGKDGYQVALHLRRRPEFKGMLLIAVTGYDWKGAPLRSTEYGFDHHLVKPVDPEMLRALLSSRAGQGLASGSK